MFGQTLRIGRNDGSLYYNGPMATVTKVDSDDLNIGAEQNLAIRFKLSIVVYTLTSVVVTHLMLEREQKPGRCWNIPLLIEALPSLT